MKEQRASKEAYCQWSLRLKQLDFEHLISPVKLARQRLVVRQRLVLAEVAKMEQMAQSVMSGCRDEMSTAMIEELTESLGVKRDKVTKVFARAMAENESKLKAIEKEKETSIGTIRKTIDEMNRRVSEELKVLDKTLSNNTIEA